jgi:quinolinate synthase
VYINTSLRTKALSHAAVPTITCTSSNVVQTVLQARAWPPLLKLPCSSSLGSLPWLSRERAGLAAQLGRSKIP